MITANGPPNDKGRFVTRMNVGPRRLRACSFAASDAATEDAGYSPPAPYPPMPLISICAAKRRAGRRKDGGEGARTEANRPTSNSHHPKHAGDGIPM